MNNKLIKPNKLEKGDTIGIISPSSPLAGLVPHRVERGIKMIEHLGFKVVIAPHALNVRDYVSGTPKERADDINLFFADKNIKAIFSFIGGNHSNQILEYLDFELIKSNPKIFLGYSDVTVLHFSLLTQSNLVTFYGPAVLTQFAENPKMFDYTTSYLLKALFADEPIGKIIQSQEWTDETLDWFQKEDNTRKRKTYKNDGWYWIKNGSAKGKILGGCITSMMHVIGTKYCPDFQDSILFWEIPEGEDFSKGESVSAIDAHLTDLKNYGVFDSIKGMIIGRPFGYNEETKNKLIEIIKNQTNDYDFPILFGVDIGHTDPMITVPIGVEVKIDSSTNTFEFIEKGIM
jgi:muramoyltetrapeptide carboxypeptidase